MICLHTLAPLPFLLYIPERLLPSTNALVVIALKVVISDRHTLRFAYSFLAPYNIATDSSPLKQCSLLMSVKPPLVVFLFSLTVLLHWFFFLNPTSVDGVLQVLSLPLLYTLSLVDLIHSCGLVYFQLNIIPQFMS